MPRKKVMIGRHNFTTDEDTERDIKILKLNCVNVSKFIRDMIHYYASGFDKEGGGNGKDMVQTIEQ
jgi:hypothetical protein